MGSNLTLQRQWRRVTECKTHHTGKRCSFSAQAIPAGRAHAPLSIQSPFQPQVAPLFGPLVLLLLLDGLPV
jgi:hypothetical protein